MAKKNPPSAATSPASPTDATPAKDAFTRAVPPGGETPRLRPTFKNEFIRRPAVLGEAPQPSAPKRETPVTSVPFWVGVAVTFAWFGAVAAVAFEPSGNVFGFPVSNIALALSGAVAPPALLWMVIAYLQRASDIRTITEPLRRQLQMVLGTGAQAENRVRRFNDALEKQLELLARAGDGSYEVLQGAIQVLQEEEQAIHVLTERSSKEVSRVAGVVRDNSEILEDLLHSNRERFDDLATRIGGHIASLDDKTDAAVGRLSGMVDKLHSLIGDFLMTADKKLGDYDGVAGQISMQEKESVEATRRMSDMLGAARAGAIELNQILAKNQDMLESSGSRLLSRMQDVSAETQAFAYASDEKERALAEKSQQLSHTLAREIATLETLTNRLESQIGVANESLTQRSNELEEKQGKLAAQAGQLLQGLQSTVQEMEQSAGMAFEKFGHTSEQVQQQAMRAAHQFQMSTEQYDKISGKLETISAQVVSRVASIGDTLATQSVVIEQSSEKAKEASAIAQNGVAATLDRLELMIARIFDAENKAKISVQEMNKSYSASLDGLQGKLESFGVEVDRHVAAIDQVQDSFDEAGTRLAERARQTEGTWQSLVAAAERQQDILQEQLRTKIEEATFLLNENAAAIEGARDGLYMQIEAAFSRAGDIREELGHMGRAIEKPFEDGVRQMQVAASQGQMQISSFMETLSLNAQHLTGLNVQLAEQQEKAGHRAAETLAGLDAVAARIEAIQHDNMQTTQDVLMRLSTLAQQLQSRMTELSSTAEGEQSRLAEVARQLSMEINGLIHDSQTADTRVRIAATLLSEQATDVRQRLEAQAEAIGQTLDTLNQRFAGVAGQMHEIARLNDTGLDGRVADLSQTVRDASAALEAVGSQLDTRGQQIASMQGQLQEGGRVLDQTTQAALDRLSVFTHAMVASQSTSAEAAQSVFARLNDMQEQFTRQVSAVSDGSQSITQSMRSAVADLVEQSVALAAASQAAESKVSSLTIVTSALEQQAHAVRAAVESEATVMQNRMGDMLSQVQSATVGLERHASIAFDRSQGMVRHFEDLSSVAFTRVGEAADALTRMADASIAKAEDVSRALEHSAEKVTFAGVHLAEIESEVRMSAERNAEKLNQIAAETGAKALFAADQLHAQINDLKTEAENMLGRFNIVGQGFASQSATVAGVAGELENSLSRMQGTCTILSEEGTRAAERISGQTLQFRAEIEGALGNLAASGDALQNRGDFAIAMLHQMATRFAEATHTLRGQFEQEVEHLHTVSNGARAELEEFASRLSSHTGRLDGTAAQLNESGRNIGETLEKANFLLRNLSTQTERVKGGVEEISGSLLQKLSEMLCTFEDELKGLTTTTGLGVDELQRKAAAATQNLREEAETASRQIEAIFATLPDTVQENFSAAARHAENAVEKLRAQSSATAATVEADVARALEGAAAQMLSMQDDFRMVLAAAAETVAAHLRQVQESGAGVMEIMRTGTTAGAEQALQSLAQIRLTAEEEVKAMALAVEQNLAQMQNFSDRIRTELSANSDETRSVAGQIFASVRQSAEHEMQALLDKAHGTLGMLQDACDGLTHDMQATLNQAHGTAQDFAGITEALRAESQRAASTVAEAGQNIVSANTLLQHSQTALSETAVKSTETLQAFNDNISAQARNLVGIQTSIVQVAQNMGQTDDRLAAIQKSFEGIVGDITERLNQGLYSLSKQMLAVRKDAEGAVESVQGGSNALAGQNAAIAQTASALAAALSQLEHVGQNLASNLRTAMDEAENSSATIEHRASRILDMSNAAGATVSELATRMQSELAHVNQAATALQTPIEQFDALNSRLSNMLSMASQAAKLGTPAPAAPPQPYPAPSYQVPPAPPAPRAAAPVQAPMARTTPRPAVPAAPAARNPDNELVNSLTQIIQQLEETAGGSSAVPVPRSKTGK